MTNEEIKQDVIEACREFEKLGYKVDPVHFCVSDEEEKPVGGCALSAVAVTREGAKLQPIMGDLVFGVTAKRYGWDESQTWAFISGFDAPDHPTHHSPNKRKHPDLYRLGQQVNKELFR